MKSFRLYHVAPRRVEWREEELSPPRPGEVRIKTLYSGISAGTELLFYRGAFPAEMEMDSQLSSLRGEPRYPFRYGYGVSGEVVEVGPGVDDHLLNRNVFAFQPHESDFCVRPEDALPIPSDLSPEKALFFPAMETALNLVLDAAPLVGERVCVFGQGVQGLLVTGLLSRFPSLQLTTFEPSAERRILSRDWGAHESLDPSLEDSTSPDLKADLCLELSGNPKALNQAVARTAFSGRVIIGSWYGRDSVPLDLGSSFHRSRIRLVSSQVSTINPELTGRWDRRRRRELVWNLLREYPVESLVTHILPRTSASEVFQQLSESSPEHLKVLLSYER